MFNDFTAMEKTAFWNAFGRAVATGPLNLMGNIAFGRKAAGGIREGRRFHNPNGFKEVKKERYDAVLESVKKGEKGTPRVSKSPFDDGKYLEEKYRPGGLAGFAMKNPMAAAGMGGVGYLMLKNRAPSQQVAEQQQQQYQSGPAYSL